MSCEYVCSFHEQQRKRSFQGSAVVLHAGQGRFSAPSYFERAHGHERPDATRQVPIDEQEGSEDGNSALSDEDAYQAAADAEDADVLGSDSDGGRASVEPALRMPAPASSRKAAKRAKAAARAEAEAEAAAAVRAEARAEGNARHQEAQTYHSEEERLVRLPWD